MKTCAFCEVVAGQREAQVFPGHVLLVPRTYHATLMDLPPELLQPLFAEAQRLGRALVRGLGAEGVFVALNNRVSQSVPHLHVHVVPRRRGDGLKGFFWPRVSYRDAAHEQETAERLRAALAEIDPDATAPGPS